MNIVDFKEGDSIRTFCYACDGAETITFKSLAYKDTPSQVLIPNILQGICNTCGTVAIIPKQSSQGIIDHLNKLRGVS